MRHINRSAAAWATVVTIVTMMALAASALALTPNINGVAVFERVFNDCPFSTVVTANAYPASIAVTDEITGCFGFANRHAWRLSSDGGATAAEFPNFSHFVLRADLELTATTGQAEAGLQISPWWSQTVDGTFNVRLSDGEIAVFGGRLPFYSFTASQGLNYTGGVIGLEMGYFAHGLSAADPATVQYVVHYQGSTYGSGNLPFDEGNPGEDPPYDLWGILNKATVGGFVQALGSGGSDNEVTATWTDIKFCPLDAVPTESKTWGAVKSLYGN